MKMDPLSKFLTDSFGKSKIASAPVPIVVPQLDAFEKTAYGKMISDMCSDEAFLSQFEGTPLLPQAIALAEQELAMEQQQLQQRMQRVAQQNNENWEQDCIARDGLRLQKTQLLLELFKTKAMTPAPKPGDAVIGQPEIASDAAMGATAPGADGGGAVQEAQVPKTAGVLKEDQRRDFALPEQKKFPIPDEAHGRNALARASQYGSPEVQAKIRSAVHKKFPGIKETSASKPAEPTVKETISKTADVREDKPHYLPEILPFGSTYVGARRAPEGQKLEGAVRGALGGTVGGSLGMAMGQMPGVIAGSPAAAVIGRLLGGVVGGAQGTHLATRGLLPQKEQVEEPKLGTLLDSAAQAGWSRAAAPVKNFARTVSAAGKVT